MSIIMNAQGGEDAPPPAEDARRTATLDEVDDVLRLAGELESSCDSNINNPLDSVRGDSVNTNTNNSSGGGGGVKHNGEVMRLLGRVNHKSLKEVFNAASVTALKVKIPYRGVCIRGCDSWPRA
jgi:hypothetical protein